MVALATLSQIPSTTEIVLAIKRVKCRLGDIVAVS